MDQVLVKHAGQMAFVEDQDPFQELTAQESTLAGKTAQYSTRTNLRSGPFM
jgi:hypothetical protein